MIERVHTRAEKRQIVLLHGWGMRASVWNEVAGDLAQHFAVHAFDLPGYGDSRTCDPYTLDEISDMLAAAAPPRVTLCGWSLGGQIALAWTLRRPQQVERLALIATTPCFVARDQWEHGMAAAVLDEFEQRLIADPKVMLQRLLALQTRGDADAGALPWRLRERMAVADAKVLCAGLALLRATDLRPRLRHVVQPALILHGDGDVVVPLGAGMHLQRELPDAALEVLSGAGHVPLVSRSHDVARHIVEFCNER